jgi:hypothetical protein
MLITQKDLLKDRLIIWHRLLEVKAGEPSTLAAEAAACATVAADIAIKILKLEIDGLKAVQSKVIPLVQAAKRQLHFATDINENPQWESIDNSQDGRQPGAYDSRLVIKLSQSTDSIDEDQSSKTKDRSEGNRIRRSTSPWKSVLTVRFAFGIYR